MLKANQIENLADGIYQAKREHIPDIAELLTHAFLKNNEVWASYNLDRNQILDFLKGIVLEHIEAQQRLSMQMGRPVIMNQISIIGGKLRSAMLHYQIDQYRRMIKNSKQSEIPLFRSLEKAGKQLTSVIDLETLEKGKHFYLNFGGSDEESLAKRINVMIGITCLEAMHDQGYHSVFFRSTNIRAIKLYQKLGGKLLKQVQFKENGKQFPLYFLRIELNNPILQGILSSRRKHKLVKALPSL